MAAPVSVDMSAIVPLTIRVTADRVLIRADREDHAPTQTPAGVYLASSLAAAVTGADPSESWFVGTIVQVGPLVNTVDVRATVLRWIRKLEPVGEMLLGDGVGDCGLGDTGAELSALRQRIEALPAERPDPLCVGDRVVFSWAAGQGLTLNGERFVILRASEVLAVLEE